MVGDRSYMKGDKMNIDNRIYALKAAISTLEKAYEHNRQARIAMAQAYENAADYDEKDAYMSARITLIEAMNNINDEICRLYCEIEALKRERA